MNITDYETLLSAAKQQAEPQRLLFVFLRTSLPKDHEGDEENDFQSGQGGALEPVMCVDKTPEELSNFADLVTESERINADWQIVILASLSGKNGNPPLSDDADEPFKKMIHTVETGGDLSGYMAFDREGTPIEFT